MSQHPSTVRSPVRLWQQEILFVIGEVVNHRVLGIEGLHAMAKFIFVFGIHPSGLLMDDLLDRSDTAIESFVEVVQVVFDIQFVPSFEVQSLQEFSLLCFRKLPCIELLLVRLVEIVDGVSKGGSIEDIVLVRCQQLTENILVFFQDVHDEKISIFFVHCRVVFAVVSKSTRAILVFKHLVGLGVAKKLLEKTQDPWFVDRIILKYACDLALRIVSAVEFPCLGGLEKFRIGSAICERKSDGKGHFSAGQHSTPVGVLFAQTNLNSVNGFVV